MLTGRRYDPESGNYYYRARIYSPELGRFLSRDPLGYDAGDYNLYRYVFNNPVNMVDPTGEFAFAPWLLKASAEALADALLQAVVLYYIDPEVNTALEAFQNIDPMQVGLAFLTGLLPGSSMGHKLARIAIGAAGIVLLNYIDALSNCREYTAEQALQDFGVGLAWSFFWEVSGNLVVRYGPQVVATGFRKMGFDELATRVLRSFSGLNRAFFQKFTPGQGFSTATDLGSGTTALFPSTPDIRGQDFEMRNGIKWVAQNGGHYHGLSDLLQRGANRADIYGYTVRWNSDGLEVISWNSGTINPGRTVPQHLRPQIIEALSKETGLEVVERLTRPR